MVEAAKLRKRDKRESYDQIWCVFDTEAKLTQKCRDGFRVALNSATHAKILIATSNPCFEIWLCWHKADQAAWISSDAIQSRCKELGLLNGKQILDADALVKDCYQAAKNRACSIVQIHDRNGTHPPEDRNPSSGLYLLIDAICEAFGPKE